MTKNRIALVVGATGGIGGAVARALVDRGWTVRGLNRQPEAAARKPGGEGIEWVKGDAMNAEDVIAAAKGASIVFHGANPPGYRNWQGLALPMLESTIAAAKAAGARIVFPGTIYNFGPDALPSVDEQSPQRPTTRKGKIRVAMEKRLRETAAAGTPVLIVRAGDFFGPVAGNNWFGAGIVKAGKPVTRISYPGRPEVGHDWAYLPDLAETFLRLIERADELAPFEVFHFRGHYFDRGIAIAEAVRTAIGRPDMKIGRFPWFAIYLAAPFVEMFRELIEVRYLWTERLELDNRKLVRFLGAEPHTPLIEALTEALRGMGCMPVALPRPVGTGLAVR
ncbi:membrane protein [Kaistia sp. 32K]|uniref:NAD-dependent epimerase/dehydratase family protein n=1 Tax=Kaistia sp. 32K TaxID=2795690 RepID=UPI001914FACA|nr:NAD-dependent epimerase/dehydratase family protein [Kaistia sp. 32K]BCP54904.1 membrane protein [Kaistia sp. 32K]